MADPEVDHKFIYNSQEKVDIIQSPFFDPGFGSEGTVEEYMERILYSLTDVIEEQQTTGSWKIAGRPPVSPTPTNSLLIKIASILCLAVASLGLLTFVLR
ncbi:hypothetical protein MA16_Dca007400 [Dendrobium catenatum]|uniref:Uncharacterized protein n=1 Tax=Dendrobium catenatum TaxID=906689 RepID=A0A2I0W8P5_9ASPA|nr:hypothetical protein MA16_Dca007400 [Dendrobium catenatum]